MAASFPSKIVSSKIEVLTELKTNLQLFLDDANEVLQLAKSWLSNEDDTKKFTFADINKMIEDKLAFLGSTDFSVGHEKTTIDQYSTVSLPPSSSVSTDQQHFGARNGQISDELKTVMNQVKAMQDEMSFIITSSVTLSEKQSAMEECFESLSDKYSKIEQEKIREIEVELTNISEKQKITTENQEQIMENFENKIQAVTEKQSFLDELQQSKIENCERKIQTVSDAQSDILENCHQLQCKINDHKTENEKQSQQFLQDFIDVLESIKEFKSQISVLENQAPLFTQLEALKNKVTLLEANSENLSEKFEEYDLCMEEFTRKNEKACQNLSAVQIKNSDKLQKFEMKLATLEISFNETSYEAGKLYEDMDTKYEMVCRVVAGRVAAMEKLRNIFNTNLLIRKNNEKKQISTAEEDQLSKLKNQTIVHVQNCKGDLPNRMCSYKDALRPLQEKLGEKEKIAVKPSASTPTPAIRAGAKNIPPALKEGAKKSKVEFLITKRAVNSATIMVNNLSEDTIEPELEALFHQFGPISSIYLVRDNFTHQSKGYAFIYFDRREDASKAILKMSVGDCHLDHMILGGHWAKSLTQKEL